MRVALLSDIHANLVALDAVLEDILLRRIDQIICLGDVATLGPQPSETVARLRDLKCPCITGNHEVALLTPQSLAASDGWVREASEWALRQLSLRDLKYLQSFQPSLEVQLDASHKMLCYHGSPRSENEFVFSCLPDHELYELLASLPAAVIALGHTHEQMLRQYSGKLIINPGSIGCPFEMPWDPKTSPRLLLWAEYAIVEARDGALSVELHRVPLDMRRLSLVARRSTMPGIDYWLSAWQMPGAV